MLFPVCHGQSFLGAHFDGRKIIFFGHFAGNQVAARSGEGVFFGGRREVDSIYPIAFGVGEGAKIHEISFGGSGIFYCHEITQDGDDLALVSGQLFGCDCKRRFFFQ